MFGTVVKFYQCTEFVTENQMQLYDSRKSKDFLAKYFLFNPGCMQV